MGSLRLLGCVLLALYVTSKELSEREKNILAEKLGFNLEDRRARLKKIGHEHTFRSSSGNGNLSGNVVRLPSMDSSNIKDAQRSIFDINTRDGVAPYLYHGDIILSERQLSYIEEQRDTGIKDENESTRSKRQIVKFVEKWDTDFFFYEFEDNLSEKKLNAFDDAILWLSGQTCLKCGTAMGSAPNGIKVINGVGCPSGLGLEGGTQLFSIGDGCEHIGLVVHEIMHALGIYHTQSRSDRDTYVKYNNVHVIVTKECSPNSTPNCKNGGVPHPNACGKCKCPSGYAGDICDSRRNGCGFTLIAKPEWKTEGVSVPEDTTCNHWVTAPEGRIIQVRIEEMTNLVWGMGCPWFPIRCQLNGVEVKSNPDPRIVNPRLCCSHQMNSTYTSALDSTPVVSYNTNVPKRRFISNIDTWSASHHQLAQQQPKVLPPPTTESKKA